MVRISNAQTPLLKRTRWGRRLVGTALSLAVAAAAAASPAGRHALSSMLLSPYRPATGQPAVVQAPRRVRHVPGTTLVRFRPGTSPATITGFIRGLRARQTRVVSDLGVHVLKVAPKRMANVLAALQSSPLVASVERDPVAVPATTVPNDPYYPWNGSNVLVGGEWPHGAMHDACCSGVTQDDPQPTVWEQTVGSSSVVLADVDSGVDFAHPDLSGKQVAGVSEVGGDTVDTSGHGEYIAGTMAADTNNGIGVAGVCWACMIMPVKITTGSFATYDAMASGITWAADHGARVINVSYAGTSQSSTLDSAVQYATSHGAIVVAAAGNSGCNCPTYPAASPGAIGVAATDQFGNFMTYSNHGTWVPLAAPTGQITTWLKDPSTGQPYGYGPVGGTSISAPMVAGLLGLMISADPTATVSALKNALFSTANPTTGLDQGESEVRAIRSGRRLQGGLGDHGSIAQPVAESIGVRQSTTVSFFEPEPLSIAKPVRKPEPVSFALSEPDRNHHDIQRCAEQEDDLPKLLHHAGVGRVGWPTELQQVSFARVVPGCGERVNGRCDERSERRRSRSVGRVGRLHLRRQRGWHRSVLVHAHGHRSSVIRTRCGAPDARGPATVQRSLSRNARTSRTRPGC